MLKKKLQKIFNSWIIWKADHEDAYYKNIPTEKYSTELVKRLISEHKYKRPNGRLKILKVYQNQNWEDLNLLPALRAFGDVVEYQFGDAKPYSLVWQFFKKRAF